MKCYFVIRMHPEIAAYPSNRFYSGKLTTDSKMILLKSHEKPFHSDSSGRFRPFVFHDLDYGSECLEGNSYSNQAEAQYAIWLFQHLSEQYPSHASNIGVIAPYLAQRRLLNRVFTKCPRIKLLGGASIPSLLKCFQCLCFRATELFNHIQERIHGFSARGCGSWCRTHHIMNETS